MNLKSIPEAARQLGVSAQRLRRGIWAGRYPRYEIGGRLLVDVEELAGILAQEAESIGVTEAAKLTGLSARAIRRGAQSGELPCIRLRHGYRFDPARLMEALGAKKKP